MTPPQGPRGGRRDDPISLVSPAAPEFPAVNTKNANADMIDLTGDDNKDDYNKDEGNNGAGNNGVGNNGDEQERPQFEPWYWDLDLEADDAYAYNDAWDM